MLTKPKKKQGFRALLKDGLNDLFNSSRRSRPSTPGPSSQLEDVSHPADSPSAQMALIKSLETLYQSIGVFPPLEVAIGALILCVDGIEISSENHGEYEELTSSIAELSQSLVLHLRKSRSVTMSESIERMAISIEEHVKIVSEERDRGTGRDPTEAKCGEKDIIDAYQGVETLFRQLQIEVMQAGWNFSNQQRVRARLEILEPSKLAVYNPRVLYEISRRTFTKGAGAQILSDLNRWSLDPNAPKIYFLNGTASTGKTTIAHMFADTLKGVKALAASFFCTRTSGECHEVERIVPTIAYQLACYSASFRFALSGALDEDGNIKSWNIVTQFNRLIEDPLRRVKDAMPSGLVVIIDALDECSNLEGAGLILEILLNAAPNLPLKFFVASRPDPEIQTWIKNQDNQTLSTSILHEIDRLIMQNEIELYLQEELGPTAISPAQLKQLAECCGCSFIYATTAIKYIVGKDTSINYEDRLRTVLDLCPGTNHRHEEIDNLYTTVLEDALENPSLNELEKQQTRVLLWTVVCACEPINVETLVAFMEIETTKAPILLERLFPVLHFLPLSQTISTLHASFLDFLFDKHRSGRFYCDKEAYNQFLSERCFGIMKKRLRFNIGNLESSFLFDSQVADLETRIEEAVSPALAYAIIAEAMVIGWRLHTLSVQVAQ
ncbi:unnamed protein product [Rhizoctonia solani]|uniref:Nephrocystin 3-like N-terminal domain-containing protein n=1 Tax=Rhizoctonia solani TaxID=456999 RepID=A0A8H3GTL7_9AGAM|nr:unnamed protein product [Rhizoctonia solani]